MEQEKKFYLIKVSKNQYEPCIDFDDYDIDSLSIVALYAHESYETARQHAIEIITNEYPITADYLFCEPDEDEEEDEDYEPEFENGEFYTLQENPDDYERFVFKCGYEGNNIGPCMCFQLAELAKISITEETLLP